MKKDFGSGVSRPLPTQGEGGQTLSLGVQPPSFPPLPLFLPLFETNATLGVRYTWWKLLHKKKLLFTYNKKNPKCAAGTVVSMPPCQFRRPANRWPYAHQSTPTPWAWPRRTSGAIRAAEVR